MAEKRPMQTARIKIISMGDAEVGKSCLIKRFCEKRFVSKYMGTIGIDYGVTKSEINGQEIKINIFDMAGHPLFYEVRNEFYKDSQGAILAYDVTSRSSFESLPHWIEEMKKNIGPSSEANNLVVYVCATKIDIGNRKVDELEGRMWAEQNGYHYFETSAHTGKNVDELFKALFKSVVNRLEGANVAPVTAAFSKEQADAVRKLRTGRNDHERLGVPQGASRDDINKAYRKLAVILHPDKCTMPGSEEAFKILVSARASLLTNARH
ncbi:dnaJ homolog subfamily C member 27-like [Oscarella lobularis]|uniref:dnaJ homolog subfamily C member 27-like n=1 Tax=Oscarella lobularis TaxID=121494 RepID=UPI00331329D8